MRIVVTGRTGQLVTSLLERGPSLGVEIIAVGRPQLDLTNMADSGRIIADLRPDVMVSAAAYTAVDQAQSDIATAELVNTVAPGRLGTIAAALAIPIVHISTDYVFDGTKPSPYCEPDEPNPLGVYGRTKLRGEQAIAAATQDHAILRTAWVYGPFGKNFLRTMLRLAADRSEIGVVGDQFGNPSSALELADAVVQVCRNLCDRRDDSSIRGIFHMTGSGEASWAEFAAEIFEVSQRLGGPASSVRTIATSDYPTPAPRPANSRLNTTKLSEQHGVVLAPWQVSTRQVIERLMKQHTD